MKEDAQKLRKKIALALKAVPVTPAHTATMHRYKVGKQAHSPVYDSVTTKCGIIDKGYLKQWAVGQAIRHIRENFKEENTLEEREAVLSEAEIMHETVLNDAGSVGTIVHNAIERFLIHWIEEGSNPSPISSYLPKDRDQRAVAAAMAAEGFLRDHDVVPVMSEMLVASDTMQVAGTLDCLAYVDGELAIVDWKTSNSVDKPEYLMQVAAYRECLEEMTGIDVKQVYIVRLDKKSGFYTEHAFKKTRLRGALRAFKDVCRIYDWLNSGDASLQKQKVTLKL